MPLVDAKPDPVPVKVDRVLVSQQEAVVILAPEKDLEFQGKVLPVFVDLGQAMNIQVSLEGRLMGRPLTHDLFTQVLNEMGAIVDHIVIEDLAQNTFFATLHVEIEKKGKRETVTFDARPSDCLALAVRSGAPILCRRPVLESAAVERDRFMDAGGGEGGPDPYAGMHPEDVDEDDEDDDDDEAPPPKRRPDRIDPGEAERP